MLLVRLLPACAVKDPPFARGPARLLCLSLSVSVLCLHRVHHSPEFPSGFLLPLTSFVTCASVVPGWVFLSQADPDQYMALLVRPWCVTLRIFQSTVVCTILVAVCSRGRGPRWCSSGREGSRGVRAVLSGRPHAPLSAFWLWTVPRHLPHRSSISFFQMGEEHDRLLESLNLVMQ